MGEDRTTIDRLEVLGELADGEHVRASSIAGPLGGVEAFGKRIAPNALAPAIGGINGLAEKAAVELRADAATITSALRDGSILVITNRRIIVLSTEIDSANPDAVLFSLPVSSVGAIRTGSSRRGFWKLQTITICTADQEIGFEFPRVASKDARRVIEACQNR